MLPPVFTLLKSNATVTSIVGERIYRHGNAPEGVARPYITWFVVSGMPELNVSSTPCTDRDMVQIDCWSESDSQIETLAYAVRAVLDSAGIANRIVQDSRENDTKLYRIALEADFISSR